MEVYVLYAMLSVFGLYIKFIYCSISDQDYSVPCCAPNKLKIDRGMSKIQYAR